MSEIWWIKLSTDMFNDEKIRLIEAMPDADTLLVIWVKLMCQAGKVNADGYIFLSRDIPFTDENLATLFNRPVNTIRLALSTFERLKMITVDEKGVIFLPNWSKYQNIEGMDFVREQARIRQQIHRANKQLPLGNVTSRDNNVTVTTQIKSKTKSKDIDNSNNKGVFGEFKNVLLSEDELSKLNARFGDDTVKVLIEKLSCGIESKGYKYKSHYAAILNWQRMDIKRGNTNGTNRGYSQKSITNSLPTESELIKSYNRE